MLDRKKSIFFTIVFILNFIPFYCFSNELSGKDLQKVLEVLDGNIYISNDVSVEKKLEYLGKLEKSVEESNELSAEARLICNNSLILMKEMAKVEFKPDFDMEQSAPKKSKDPKAEKIAMDCFNSYKEFAESHENLSSRFWFHYKEAEFSTLPYLPVGQQLEILKNTLNDYKKIENMNPDYSENLLTLSMILYYMPEMFGGDKKASVEKAKKAVETALCNYEKVNALTLYSQFLLLEDKVEESRKCIKSAYEINPDSKMLSEIIKMNEMGYSIFDGNKYYRKVLKDEKRGK